MEVDVGDGIVTMRSRSSVDETVEKLDAIIDHSGEAANVSYNCPQYLQRRHGLPQELLQNIALVETLASNVTD